MVLVMPAETRDDRLSFVSAASDGPFGDASEDETPFCAGSPVLLSTATDLPGQVVVVPPPDSLFWTRNPEAAAAAAQTRHLTITSRASPKLRKKRSTAQDSTDETRNYSRNILSSDAAWDDNSAIDARSSRASSDGNFSVASRKRVFAPGLPAGFVNEDNAAGMAQMDQVNMALFQSQSEHHEGLHYPHQDSHHLGHDDEGLSSAGQLTPDGLLTTVNVSARTSVTSPNESTKEIHMVPRQSFQENAPPPPPSSVRDRSRAQSIRTTTSSTSAAEAEAFEVAALRMQVEQLQMALRQRTHLEQEAKEAAVLREEAKLLRAKAQDDDRSATSSRRLVSEQPQQHPRRQQQQPSPWVPTGITASASPTAAHEPTYAQLAEHQRMLHNQMVQAQRRDTYSFSNSGRQSKQYVASPPATHVSAQQNTTAAWSAIGRRPSYPNLQSEAGGGGMPSPAPSQYGFKPQQAYGVPPSLSSRHPEPLSRDEDEASAYMMPSVSVAPTRADTAVLDEMSRKIESLERMFRMATANGGMLPRQSGEYAPPPQSWSGEPAPHAPVVQYHQSRSGLHTMPMTPASTVINGGASRSPSMTRSGRPAPSRSSISLPPAPPPPTGAPPALPSHAHSTSGRLPAIIASAPSHASSSVAHDDMADAQSIESHATHFIYNATPSTSAYRGLPLESSGASIQTERSGVYGHALAPGRVLQHRKSEDGGLSTSAMPYTAHPAYHASAPSAAPSIASAEIAAPTSATAAPVAAAPQPQPRKKSGSRFLPSLSISLKHGEPSDLATPGGAAMPADVAAKTNVRGWSRKYNDFSVVTPSAVASGEGLPDVKPVAYSRAPGRGGVRVAGAPKPAKKGKAAAAAAAAATGGA